MDVGSRESRAVPPLEAPYAIDARDRLGILWSYYFRGFATRSAVAFSVFGFDARDRASLRNKKT